MSTVRSPWLRKLCNASAHSTALPVTGIALCDAAIGAVDAEKGVTFSSFVNLLKEVFVEVAEREFRLDGKPPSDSRINLLTGVHRKDVRRLRSQVWRTRPACRKQYLLARIW